MNNSRGTLATIVKSGVLKTRVRPRPIPSLFVFPGLTSTAPIIKAASSPSLLAIAQKLEASYDVVLAEYLALRKHLANASDYQEEAKDEAKLHKGKWSWNSYLIQGERRAVFATQCPHTTELLESFRRPTLMTDTPFSFAFFSTMGPGATIAPHHGPCNLRIRCHFPLIVPGGDPNDCGMEVGGEVVSWTKGKPLFFDDAYEHRVWNNTKEERVVLLFDLWHPELHEQEIDAVKDMFSFAREQGWLAGQKQKQEQN